MTDDRKREATYKSIAVKLAAFCCRLYHCEELSERMRKEGIGLAHEFKAIDRAAATFGGESACPFCGERDFDLPGLKLHINAGWCEQFNDTEDLMRIAGR